MKVKIICILIMTLLIATTINAVGTTNEKNYENFMIQPPSIQWTNTFGGPGWDDAGYWVQQTNDGGYIITGFTSFYGPGTGSVWLIKTDSSGNQVWNQFYGGLGFDRGYEVQQTNDGGYIIVGETNSYGAGDFDVWLIKTDSSGNQQWTNTFGGTMQDIGYSVRQTSDGGYIISGYHSTGGLWLIKTDSGGNQQWDQKFGGNNGGHSVRQTSDGGYIVVGSTDQGAGYNDVWLIKTDSSGNQIWNQIFGGIENDEGYSVQQTTDTGYIIAGETESFGAGSDDVWLIKTDSSGNKQWDYTFGGSNFEQGNCVYQTSDGGYVIGGSTYSYGSGEYDVWAIKTDSSGNIQWNLPIGGTETDIGSCIQQTNDGGYIIVGWTYILATNDFEVYLIKLGSGNSPPNQPSTPSGPTRGKIGTTYTYSSTAIDPDGDLIWYWFDWGDNSNSGWVGPYPSGITGSASHSWSSKGNYQIKVQAKDDPQNTLSIWSNPQTVTIPRNKAINNPILQFLQSHPNLFPLLQKLL